jgi:hypothetical protein
MTAINRLLGLLPACVVVATVAPATPVLSKPNDISHYVWAEQAFSSHELAWGVGAILPQEMPYVPIDNDPNHVPKKNYQYYSITQLALGRTYLYSASAIEYGWFVNPAEYPDSDARPHMFLGLRGEGVNLYCYIDMKTCNASDGSCSCQQPEYAGGNSFMKAFFPLAGAEAYPGDPLDPADEAFFYIGYFEGNHAWWIQYRDRWIGYIPDDGGGSFAYPLSGADKVAWYGEVNTPKGMGESCVGMGNGYPGTDGRAARITDMIYLDSLTGRIESAEAHFTDYGDKEGYSGGFYTWKAMPSYESGPFDAFNYGGEGWNCSIARKY